MTAESNHPFLAAAASLASRFVLRPMYAFGLSLVRKMYRSQNLDLEDAFVALRMTWTASSSVVTG
jgi:hypothetical protein